MRHGNYPRHVVPSDYVNELVMRGQVIDHPHFDLHEIIRNREITIEELAHISSSWPYRTGVVPSYSFRMSREGPDAPYYESSNGPVAHYRQDKGETLLNTAAQAGRVHTLSMLLDCLGAQIDLVSESGRTPLHCACQLGSYEIASLLLEHRASSCSSCPALRAVVDFESAATCGVYPDIGGTPLQVEKPITTPNPFILPATTRIQTTPKLTPPTTHSPTPNHTNSQLASLMGATDMVRLLIHHGASVNLAANFRISLIWINCPPLHLASLNGDIEIVDLLLQNGADPSTLDRDGAAASHVAAEQVCDL